MAFEQQDSYVNKAEAKQETTALAEEALTLQLAYGGGGFGHCGDGGCGWDRVRQREREQEDQHPAKPAKHQEKHK